MNKLIDRKVTGIYVTLLNGNAILLEPDQKITGLSSLGDTKLVLEDVAEWLQSPHNAIQYETRAQQFSSDPDASEPWEDVAESPARKAVDTIYARGVGNVVTVYDEEITDAVE